jgi:hypothetical protein
MQILFSSSRAPQALYTMNTDGSSQSWFEYGLNVSDWQAAAAQAPAGPVRPKGASPMRVSLVPAYRKCNAPDLMHGTPLAYPSCSARVGAGALSTYLTMGTPDANGRSANAVDSIVLRVTTGDLQMQASITDVLGPGAHSDYIAELRVLMTVRLTQRIELQTTTDFPFNWSVPCTATPSPDVGSTCSVNTSANAVLPGAIPDGYRSNWQLGQIQVQDGGEDGEGATEGDNTLYLKQGIFIP